MKQTLLRSVLALIVTCLVGTSVQAQNYLQELERRLGLGKPANDASASAATESEESLPAPVRTPPPIPSPNANQPSASTPNANPLDVPAVSPVEPLGPQSPFFEIQPPADNAPAQPNESDAQVNDRPYLGLTAENLNGGGIGLRVVEVQNGSPSWKAGIRVGDNILAVDGNGVANLDQFAGEILQRKPRESVRLLIDRGGRNLPQVVVLGSANLAKRTGQLPPDAPNIEGPYEAELGTEPELALERDGQQRPSLGVQVERLSEAARRQFGIPVPRGALIVEVFANSPAARAGLAPGDCIVEAEGNVIQSDTDILSWFQTAQPGAIVTLRYFRGRNLSTANVRLGTLDSNVDPAQQSLKPPLMIAPPDAGPYGGISKIDELEAQLMDLRNQLEEKQRQLEQLRESR